MKNGCGSASPHPHRQSAIVSAVALKDSHGTGVFPGVRERAPPLGNVESDGRINGTLSVEIQA
jgi:hypothetical protein